MNEIINNFLLIVDKFVPEMHLIQAGFTYSACVWFTKNKETIQKVKEKGDSKYIYQKKQDKVCFQHEMAYGDFKDIPRRTAADKSLRDKAFNIAKTPRYYGHQGGLASMVYKQRTLCLQITVLPVLKFQVVALKVKLCKTKN